MLTSLDLDKKDLRLLELLAQNCRLTHAALATALHVSKDTVPYRLTKLEKAGILKQFVTFIDARGLGFGRYHLLFRITSQIPDLAKIVHELCKNPAVMWLNTFLGRYDIQIIVDAEDSFALNSISSRGANTPLQSTVSFRISAISNSPSLIPFSTLELRFPKEQIIPSQTCLRRENFPWGWRSVLMR